MPDLDITWMYEAVDKHYKDKHYKYEQFEDTAIRASNKMNLTDKDLFDANDKNGLMGVYDLGMKHMYDYLKENK